MKKFNRKKIWTFFLITAFFSLFCIPVHAEPDNNGDDLDVNWFNILPELTTEENNTIEEKMDEIWKAWGNVMETYNNTAKKLTTSQQVASWIMNWSTITSYLAYIVKFLSQIGLVVWTIFIMYAWYKYMVSVFSGWKVPTETIKNAIIWIIIVIFSFAIMKTLTSLVWIS